MAISNKVRGFMEKGSWIRKMFEEGIFLKQQYGEENVFDLSLGNPVMNPPAQFYKELKKISENPITSNAATNKQGNSWQCIYKLKIYHFYIHSLYFVQLYDLINQLYKILQTVKKWLQK